MEGFFKIIKKDGQSTIALDGAGRIIWNEGWEEGDFKDGVLNGNGERFWTDGRKEQGNFKDGVLHGGGQKWFNDEIIQQGIFKDGVWSQG